MLQKNAALPSGTWSHCKPMCSGEMRTAFPKQVAGLVFCLGPPRAVWVLLLAPGRGKEHVAGKVDRAAPPSSRQGCGAAGIASWLVASWLWSPDAENSPWTMGHCSPLPGTHAQVRGKSSLGAFSKFPDKLLEIIIIIIFKMNEFMGAFLFQLCNQQNAVSFPTDEHLNVLSPSCSPLMGIMRPSCAAKKKAPAWLFPNLHGCLICVQMLFGLFFSLLFC